jgi:hypothetical protein
MTSYRPFFLCAGFFFMGIMIGVTVADETSTRPAQAYARGRCEALGGRVVDGVCATVTPIEERKP